MAYNEELAARIRSAVAGRDDVTEKKMFGGLGFLLNGHMATSAYKGGDLMIRCAKEDWETFVTEKGARPMERKGKAITGWVMVDVGAVADDAALNKWVQRGLDFAASQPPK